MKIEKSSGPENVNYDTLKPGDVFESDDEIYLIVDVTDDDGDNCYVNLKDGCYSEIGFASDTKVIKLNAKVVVS